MASFTKKVLGLAGVATAFAGMAFGQAICGAPATAGTIIVRTEGTAEAVAPVTFTCTSAAANLAGSASLQVFVSLPVTSRITTSPATEARVSMVRDVDGPGGAAADAAITAQGSVAGGTISFPAVALAAVGAGGTYTFTVDSVRVNASANPSGVGGLPVAITATPYITAPVGVLNTVLLAATQVGFAQNGLAAITTRNNFTSTAFPAGTTTGTSNSSNSFVICNGYKPGGTVVAPASAALGTGAGLAFTVGISEGFAAAFKSPAQESTPAVAALLNGTRLSVNFANVPAGATIAIPNAVIPSTAAGAPTTAIVYTTAAVGTAPAAPAGASTTGNYASSGFAAGNGLLPVSISNGSGSAIFEVVAADPNVLDSFNIPVFVVTAANGVTASTAGITVSVNFAPTGASTVPNFVIGSSTNTLTTSTFSTCTTSLLFPFVTNQLGFDTGLAIANTSTDPFGTKGATNQSGTCSLNFYGSGAPPSSVTTPNVPTGTVYTQVLSGVASGFQGYLIAQCNFQYAHGFAFITNGVGVNGGLSQGYLAGVIPDVNQVNRLANPLAVAPAGSGESVGN